MTSAGERAGAMNAPLLDVRGVAKAFGAVAAVDDVSFTIREGEFFALLGPSGCGKSTLMRLIAGFETPDRGSITLGGADLATMPPHRRPVNMMFQSYALFPHLSVWDNIAYGLRRERQSKAAIAERVEEMLALVKLDSVARRRPDALSGGQRQRVALARALAKRPRLLLLDEPLGALDRKLREETQFELANLQARLGLTFMVVTHDQDEAMAMADRVAVMDRGRLLQIGPPADVYEHPVNRTVAGFVGNVTLFEGRVSTIADRRVTVETADAGPIVVGAEAPVTIGEAVAVAVRPEKIVLASERPSDRDNVLEGIVADVAYLGDVTHAKVLTGTGGRPVKVQLANASRAVSRGLARQDRVWLGWNAADGVLLED